MLWKIALMQFILPMQLKLHDFKLSPGRMQQSFYLYFISFSVKLIVIGLLIIILIFLFHICFLLFFKLSCCYFLMVTHILNFSAFELGAV